MSAQLLHQDDHLITESNNACAVHGDYVNTSEAEPEQGQQEGSERVQPATPDNHRLEQGIADDQMEPLRELAEHNDEHPALNSRSPVNSQGETEKEVKHTEEVIRSCNEYATELRAPGLNDTSVEVRKVSLASKLFQDILNSKREMYSEIPRMRHGNLSTASLQAQAGSTRSASPASDGEAQGIVNEHPGDTNEQIASQYVRPSNPTPDSAKYGSSRDARRDVRTIMNAKHNDINTDENVFSARGADNDVFGGNEVSGMTYIKYGNKGMLYNTTSYSSSQALQAHAETAYTAAGAKITGGNNVTSAYTGNIDRSRSRNAARTNSNFGAMVADSSNRETSACYRPASLEVDNSDDRAPARGLINWGLEAWRTADGSALVHTAGDNEWDSRSHGPYYQSDSNLRRHLHAGESSGAQNDASDFEQEIPGEVEGQQLERFCAWGDTTDPAGSCICGRETRCADADKTVANDKDGCSDIGTAGSGLEGWGEAGSEWVEDDFEPVTPVASDRGNEVSHFSSDTDDDDDQDLTALAITDKHEESASATKPKSASTSPIVPTADTGKAVFLINAALIPVKYQVTATTTYGELKEVYRRRRFICQEVDVYIAPWFDGVADDAVVKDLVEGLEGGHKFNVVVRWDPFSRYFLDGTVNPVAR